MGDWPTGPAEAAGPAKRRAKAGVSPDPFLQAVYIVSINDVPGHPYGCCQASQGSSLVVTPSCVLAPSCACAGVP